jgi:hypothetical protein
LLWKRNSLVSESKLLRAKLRIVGTAMTDSTA